MSEFLSRRDWIKTVGVVGAGALVPHDALIAEPVESIPVAPAQLHAPGDIVDLTSTSEIFIPPRGRSYMKFSFDFPEPSVAFGDYRFGFLVFTDENTYGARPLEAARRGERRRAASDLRRLRVGGRTGESAGQARRDVHAHRRDDRVGRRRRDGASDQDGHDDHPRRPARTGVVRRRRVHRPARR